MAASRTVLRNVDVELDGTDISEQVSQVSFSLSSAQQEATGFKAQAEQSEKGLRSDSVTLSVFMSQELDDLLWPLATSDDSFVLKVENLDAGSGADPYYIEGKLYEYTPFEGAPGDVQATELTVQNAGPLGITRTDPSGSGSGSGV